MFSLALDPRLPASPNLRCGGPLLVRAVLPRALERLAAQATRREPQRPAERPAQWPDATASAA